MVGSYPTQTVEEIARLEAAAEQERRGAEGDASRAGHWQEQYEDLGLLRRYGQDGRVARERAERFAADAEEQDPPRSSAGIS